MREFWSGPWVVGILGSALGGAGGTGIAKVVGHAVSANPRWWVYALAFAAGASVLSLALRRGRAQGKPYEYDLLDVTYHLLESNTCLELLRIGVVSKKTSLSEISMGYAWTGDGTVSEQVLTPGARLEDIEDPGPYRRRKLSWEPPLRVGDRREFAILRTCASSKPPEPYLSHQTRTASKCLVLTVIFPASRLPASVTWTERAEDAKKVDGGALEYARQIGFAQVRVMKPRLRHGYSINWTWPEP